jgi:hypothetical protein
MTQYKYQTNSSLLIEGELGVTGGQLLTKDGSNNVVVVGNPTGSTAVSDLTPSYAEEAMDISTAKTLGTGFVFLNGTSFDAMGSSDYEFEEPDGRVFGLYGRTDGMGQQIYYAGAANNQQDLQFTTVPYVPPFLSSSVWQVAAVCGGDVYGFTVALRDTSGVSLGLRYLYIKHGGTLINTAGHQYVEITQLVNSYATTAAMDAGTIPRVVRVGAYFFIAASSWTQAKVWIGGWNAQDGTYPFSTSALAGSAPSYAPTTFTIQTVNWPGTSGTSTAAQIPVVLGNSLGGNQHCSQMFRILDVTTNTLTQPVNGNYPLPPIVQWVTSSPVYLDGEVDGSGNVFLAFGTQGQAADSNANSGLFQLVYSLSVQFTAGSAGSYTNAQLTYNTPGTNGTDLLHCQPWPFVVSYNAYDALPNEAVNSNAGVPSTCVNKLPIASAWLGYTANGGGGTGMTFNWFYSGYGSIVRCGGNVLVRGKAKMQSGANLGSAAATQLNKLATIYPMFNVNPRANLSTTSGTPSSLAKVQPSGVLTTIFSGMMIAADTILSTGLDINRRGVWTVSKLPSNATLSASYNRGGTLVPGMPARVAEYPTTLSTATYSSLSSMVNVWPVGISNIKNPVNVFLPALATSSINSPNPNSQNIGVGSWTLSGGSYAPPSTTWTTSSSLSTQLAALKSSVFAAALSPYPDRFGNAMACEVVPLLNSAGTGVAAALGALWVVDAVGSSGTSVQVYFFTTPATISGGVFSLTNTASVTFLNRCVGSGLQGIPGTNPNNDTYPGRLNHVYLDATNQLVQWTPANGLLVNGDDWTCCLVAKLSGTSATSSASIIASVSRGFFGVHPQTQGLYWSPQFGVSEPQADIPISRYSTSAVSVVSDFTAGFTQAITDITNAAGAGYGGKNIAELMTLQAINNNFLLQLGAVNGRLNHKQYNLPSTFLDMTSFAVGTYYLYLTDTGTSGIQLQVDSVQRAETATNMYFGKFDRTSGGFANETSIAECLRFGTARLVSGSAGVAVQGSSIRIGSYVG